jgi:FkbM family methyltransferase
MTVVFPFSTIDQDLALKNAKWIRELGGCKGHQVLVIHDKRCVPEIVLETCTVLGQCFDQATRLTAGAEIDGWPEGANYFFRIAASWVEQQGGRCPYYMWLEPDAIPLREGWLDQIVAEYLRAKRPFMGDRVQVGDIPLHMSGVGIYPSPLHRFSGEAYRAAEIAFDMAGKDQIVPQAFFTKLIEHAWKHPGFTMKDELRTQIRPEAVLFHASKDGSLIDILRDSSTQSRQQIADRSAVQVSGPAPNGLSGREVGATSLPHKPQSEVYAGSSPVQAATCDIFIRTYPGDYQWLNYCLRSINKFASGFRKTWIVSPSPWISSTEVDEIDWRVMNDETEDGYLAQQITKLYADVITDYQSDYILHVDSDVIFTRPVTPQEFLHNGKVVWYYTPYNQIETPWQPITEKFLGQKVEYEFMRRLPIMVPRWLYPRLREACHHLHRQVISDYIKTQPTRAFSEFNALGAYAWTYHRNLIQWVDTTGDHTMPEPVARQFHSWSGLTPEVKQEIEKILGGDAPCSEEKKLNSAISDAAPTVPPAGAAIKELPNGLWVIKDDTHVSKWVEQEGRLDHDQNTLPEILPLIKEGDTVIDVGAFIGDHTIAYHEAVGMDGRVFAFEPNPIAFECLVHNMRGNGVRCVRLALGDKSEMVPLSGNNGNAAGAYLGEHMKIDDVAMVALDTLCIKPDFIKIDAEGCEFRILTGAAKTIDEHHPIIVMEVNEVALGRQGVNRFYLFDFLKEHGYTWSILQDNAVESSPMYDIVARPLAKLPVTMPVQVQPTTLELIKEHVQWLKDTCNSSPVNKSRVMQQLVIHKLKDKNPKNKQRNDRKNPKKAKSKEAF